LMKYFQKNPRDANKKKIHFETSAIDTYRYLEMNLKYIYSQKLITHIYQNIINMFILYFLIQKVLLVLKKYYIENLIVEYLQAHIITHFFGILLA